MNLRFLVILFVCVGVACSSPAKKGVSSARDSGLGTDGGGESRDSSVARDDGSAPSSKDASMAHDSGMDASDGPRALCESTGGTAVKSACCANAGDFPNTCNVGACGCSPTASVAIAKCHCPGGGCFSPLTGCSAKVCTPGKDQTCNENPVISSLHGKCLSNGTCQCHAGFTRDPDSGKCP